MDTAGNVYIADYGNAACAGWIRPAYYHCRRGWVAEPGGWRAPHRPSCLPLDVAVDSSNNLYISAGAVYKVSGLSGGSGTTPPAAPAISANGIVNGASFQPGVVANSWVTIKGTNLASQTDDWSHSIVNGALPTSLDGVSVSMGGKPAYVYFISPGQINVLAPDVPAGPVTVTVTTPGGTSASFATTASVYDPAFFLWPGSQAVATRNDYSLAVKAGTFAGATTVAAKPGDVIILWATGFGPTMPAAPVESLSRAIRRIRRPLCHLSASTTLRSTVYGAALAPGSAGLYQIAIQVPTAIADGDWPIQATIGSVTSPAGTILSVHQ